MRHGGAPSRPGALAAARALLRPKGDASDYCCAIDTADRWVLSACRWRSIVLKAAPPGRSPVPLVLPASQRCRHFYVVPFILCTVLA